jgi:hypothetical protein
MTGFSSKMLSSSAHKRRHVPQRSPFPAVLSFTAIAKIQYVVSTFIYNKLFGMSSNTNVSGKLFC